MRVSSVRQQSLPEQLRGALRELLASVPDTDIKYKQKLLKFEREISVRSDEWFINNLNAEVIVIQQVFRARDPQLNIVSIAQHVIDLIQRIVAPQHEKEEKAKAKEKALAFTNSLSPSSSSIQSPGLNSPIGNSSVLNSPIGNVLNSPNSSTMLMSYDSESMLDAQESFYGEDLKIHDEVVSKFQRVTVVDDPNEPEAPPFEVIDPDELGIDIVYPFDDEDNPNNIVYSESAKYSDIKAATLEKLIEKMTSENYIDHNLNLRYVFFLTYRSFTSAEEILFKLSERFNIPSPVNISPSEMELFQSGSVKTIKLKVLGLVQYWIKEFFSDFEERPMLKCYLDDIINISFCKDPMYSKVALSLHEIIEKQIKKLSKTKVVEFRETKDKSKALRGFVDEEDLKGVHKKLLDLDAAIIAAQVTLKDFELLKRIPVREFLGKMKNKNGEAPRIMDMINMNNRLTSWVQDFILSFEDESKRVAALKKIIYLGKHLRDLNNFSSLGAIYYGIVASPIHRLKAWKSLGKKETQICDEMKELFANRQKGLRAAMEIATNPCIPHVGLFLGDLTFLDSNENMIGKLINFRKQNMIAERIRWIKQAQQSGYAGKIVADPVFQQYIELRVKHIDQDDLWNLSIKREPQQN